MLNPASPDKSSHSCPTCHRPVEPCCQFCKTCGTPIREIKTCSKCGTPFITQEKYCDLCGATFIPGEVPESEENPESEEFPEKLTEEYHAPDADKIRPPPGRDTREAATNDLLDHSWAEYGEDETLGSPH
ncbi:MAG: zinc ribbon domain-containing protein [Methanomicrobiales archaeon]